MIAVLLIKAPFDNAEPSLHSHKSAPDSLFTLWSFLVLFLSANKIVITSDITLSHVPVFKWSFKSPFLETGREREREIRAKRIALSRTMRLCAQIHISVAVVIECVRVCVLICTFA